ncbi:MAG TPA: RsmE family RNA methyltransferase [Gemmatimonadales bacterium]|nr:RsmE family RNA methyltransferase [Gemmatimonadales bacterium]HRZ09378.1 RsmE family RNA methyltransferase [Gemmatimonadales bacterium]
MGGIRAAGAVNVLVPVGSLVTGARIVLDALEVHHLRVRRAGAGEAIRLLDGAGGVGEGTLELGRKDAVVTVGAVRHEDPPVPLVLAIGAGERDRFAWVVEKAAELGVTEIVPLETEHTRGVASRIREAQVERFRRRTLEAIKQCGATWAPQVREPVPLQQFAAEPRTGVRWLAALEGGVPPAGVGAQPVTIAVGPEGGFTPEERWAFEAAGFVPVRFGDHILRFETAALAGAVYTSIARKRGLDG